MRYKIKKKKKLGFINTVINITLNNKKVYIEDKNTRLFLNYDSPLTLACWNFNKNPIHSLNGILLRVIKLIHS